MTVTRLPATDKRTPAQIDELHKDFDFNDRNKDGRIDLVEFRNLLTDLETEMSTQETRVGFCEIDVDGDGTIDFEEFDAWWTSD